MATDNNSKKYNDLIDVWLDAAQVYWYAGAEIFRVEQILEKMALSHGAIGVNAYALISNITFTCQFEDGSIITQTRRVADRTSTNLKMLEKINALSREYCKSDMTAEELRSRLDAIINERSNTFYYMGTIVAPAAFAFFFGGSVLDAVVAGVVGLMYGALCKWKGKYFSNAFTSNFLMALVTGIIIYLLGKIMPGLQTDKAIIGVIMLLIPGISITNSIRDIVIGDTVSGSLKFIESLFDTIAIAGGYIVAMLIMGGVL